MKKKLIYILTVCMLISLSCEQETITLLPPEELPVDTSCEDAHPGVADFSKFIAIGNSFVAGMQGGALFTEGQDNSLAAILNRQFECAGAPATFNQPSINASLGWNLFITQPFLADNTKPIYGRMLLQYGTSVSCATGAPSPKPTPQAYPPLPDPTALEALPNPTFNPGFIYTATTNAQLNNFAVPAVTLGQLLTPATGNWANPNPAVGFSPFYARFASAPGTSKIISDAALSGGSFFLFWAGLDDFFLHAAYGADPNYAPLTASGTFGAYLNAALSPTTGLLATNSELKGVLGNFPDIFKMPHFTSVSYNPIPLDAATAGALTSGFAGYNALLDAIIANPGLLTNFGLDAAELTARKVSFAASCTNKILLVDESLDDLGNVFDYLRSIGAISSDGQRAALVPYEQCRHATSTDVIPLSAGSIIGTAGTFGVNGVSEPLGDRWVITPSEKLQIDNARKAFNEIVANYVAANPTRLALADVNGVLAKLVKDGSGVFSGVVVTPNINPPTGMYSEDGVHPNTRGYAVLSWAFIDAINWKFGARVPRTNVAEYGATGLPIP